jgi:hypothetical protein
MKVADHKRIVIVATNSRKHHLARELGMYLAEKGRIVPAREFKYANDRPKLLSMKEVVKVMGSYTTALKWIEEYEPELWATIHGKAAVEPEPVKVEVTEEVIAKPDPLAALAQSKTSEDDG